MNEISGDCLYIIFSHLPGDYNKRILSMVCQRWRRMASNIPKMELFIPPIMKYLFSGNSIYPFDKTSYENMVFLKTNKLTSPLDSFFIGLGIPTGIIGGTKQTKQQQYFEYMLLQNNVIKYKKLKTSEIRVFRWISFIYKNKHDDPLLFVEECYELQSHIVLLVLMDLLDFLTDERLILICRNYKEDNYIWKKIEQEIIKREISPNIFTYYPSRLRIMETINTRNNTDDEQSITIITPSNSELHTTLALGTREDKLLLIKYHPPPWNYNHVPYGWNKDIPFNVILDSVSRMHQHNLLLTINLLYITDFEVIKLLELYSHPIFLYKILKHKTPDLFHKIEKINPVLYDLKSILFKDNFIHLVTNMVRKVGDDDVSINILKQAIKECGPKKIKAGDIYSIEFNDIVTLLKSKCIKIERNVFHNYICHPNVTIEMVQTMIQMFPVDVKMVKRIVNRESKKVIINEAILPTIKTLITPP